MRSVSAVQVRPTGDSGIMTLTGILSRDLSGMVVGYFHFVDIRCASKRMPAVWTRINQARNHLGGIRVPACCTKKL